MPLTMANAKMTRLETFDPAAVAARCLYYMVVTFCSVYVFYAGEIVGPERKLR